MRKKTFLMAVLLLFAGSQLATVNAAVPVVKGAGDAAIAATPDHPPKAGAKVVREYDDNLYGKTQLRDDDYHRHWIRGQWTPWHWRHQAHNWRYEKATPPPPAPAPAPRSDWVRVGMTFPSAVGIGAGAKDCCAKVTLEKVVPAEVAVGQVFEQKLHVTNNSDVLVRSVKVTDTIPAGFKMAGSTPAATSAEGGKAVWNLGEMRPGQSKTIVIKGSATRAGQITDCATVSYVPWICATTKVVQPALKLVKELPSEVILCDPINMKIVVTNNGTGTARGVKIADNLPKGLVTQQGNSRVNLNVGDLGAGQSRQFTVALKALDTGKFNNTASASAAGGLSARDSASITVRQPVLTIAKTGPKKIFLGRNITHTIKVTNTGDAPAKDTVLNDRISGVAQFVSASDGGQFAAGTVSWKLGTLPVNGSKTVRVTVKPTGIGRVSNTATTQAYCAKAVSASSATQIAGIPAILLEVIDVEDPILVGTNVTYVITATNQGSATGTNIKIACALEDQMQFVSATGATRGTARGKVVTFAALPTLAPKAKATWRVTIKAVDEADVRFGVKMTSDQITRSVDETEATNFYK